MADENYKRKLTAILSADAVGYSRLMGQDEEATVRTIKTYREVLSTLIQQHNGKVLDSPGDNLLAEFGSVVEVVQCAVNVQNEIKARNAELSEDRKMNFRIGINLGDIIEDGDRIYGDGVNIAARIENLAEPGGVSISHTVYDHVCNKLKFGFEYQGEYKVKNINRPIQVYRVITETNSTEKLILEGRSTLPLPEKPSIAVLPFVNMSGDAEQEYFSDGITEDIITALSRSSWLFVISRNSSFSYRGASVDVKRISKELGVRYILEGSVRKAGKRVRITAQLIEGTMGSHVWAEKYDGELKDIFDLQDKITNQIVATLLTQIQIFVGLNTNRVKRPDIITWDILARGLKLFYGLTKESICKAEKIFRKAIVSAPTSCDAHWMLSASLFHQVWMGHTPDNDAAIPEAYNLAKTAISIDDNNEYAHWILGLIQFIQGKHDEAISELKRTIELNPNCSLGYGSLGTVLSFSGEPDESIRNNEIAIRSNPKDPSIFFRYSGISMAHYFAGRYLEATHWARKSIHRKPNWRIGHAVLAASLAQLNQSEEAKEAVANYLENIPNESISTLRKILSFKSPDDLSRIERGLHLAGLPE
jgi:adenylate cyclase